MTQPFNTEAHLKKRQWIEWDQMNAEQKMMALRQETFFMRWRKKLTDLLKQRLKIHEEN